MALVNIKKKIEKNRAKLGLAADEVVLAACTTNPKGTIKHMIGKEAGGLAARAVVGKDADATTVVTAEGTLGSRFPEGQRFLALTSHRLFTTDVSLMLGQPKVIDAEWPRAEVAVISVVAGRMASPLLITFTDGSAVEVEGAAGTDPNALAEAFTA